MVEETPSQIVNNAPIRDQNRNRAGWTSPFSGLVKCQRLFTLVHVTKDSYLFNQPLCLLVSCCRLADQGQLVKDFVLAGWVLGFRVTWH